MKKTIVTTLYAAALSVSVISPALAESVAVKGGAFLFSTTECQARKS